MSTEPVTEHVHLINIGAANVFLITREEGLVLVDSGMPGSLAPVADAVHSLGRRLEEITDIVVTHSHPDHAGGAPELRAATGGRIWMHPADAALVRMGQAFRPSKVTPGLRNHFFYRFVIRRGPAGVDPFEVDEEISPGQVLPVAGGLKAIGTPGHSAGHVSLLWPGDGGVLFVGDAAKHVDGRMRLSTIYEDRELGLESLRTIAGESFEVACFAHVPPLRGGAAKLFRAAWG